MKKHLFTLFALLGFLPLYAQDTTQLTAEEMFTFELCTGGVTITGLQDSFTWSGGDLKLDIPATINGVPVVAIGKNAFADCSSLTSVVIPEGVTSIGEYAFVECSSLTSVTIPEGVMSIGVGAFRCTRIQSLTLPASLESLDASVFACTPSIRKVEFEGATPPTIINGTVFKFLDAEGWGNPQQPLYVVYPSTSEKWVSSVVEGEWMGVKAISSVEPKPAGFRTLVEDGTVTIAGRYDPVEDVEIPALIEGLPVTRIIAHAFAFDKTLRTLKLPHSLKEIKHNAFDYCENLQTVDFGEGVRFIREEAFLCCKSLTTIVLPQSLEQLEGLAFAECSAIETVFFNSMDCEVLKNKDGAPFAGCYEDGESSGGMLTLNLTVREGHLLSTTSLENLKTTGWPDWEELKDQNPWCSARYYANLITSAEVENDIFTSTGTANGLMITGFKDGVTPPKTLVIPRYIGTTKITAISDEAFESAFGKEYVETIVISDSVTAFEGYGAFDCFPSVREVHIGSGLTTYPYGQFGRSGNLATITVPHDNEFFKVVDGALLSKDETILYIVPATVTSFTIPDTVTRLYDCAFASNYLIKEVTIPVNVKTIDPFAFENGAPITFVVPQEHAYFSTDENGALYNKKKTNLVIARANANGTFEMPNTVTTICDSAFTGDSRLKTIVIPDSVKAIGECAFSSCEALESIVIGAGVTTIRANVLEYCGKLTTITFRGAPATTVDENAFICDDNPISATGIYSPLVTKWKNAIVDGKWNGLTMRPDEPEVVVPSLTLATVGEGEGVLTGAKSYTVDKMVTLKAKAAANSLFAGWYTDSACTEPYTDKKVDSRTPSITFTPTAEKVYTLYGKFIPLTEENDANPLKITWREGDDEVAYDAVYDVDEPVNLTVTVDSKALPKVVAKGLPKGLKWNSKTFTITGKPTTPGVYIVTMTATNTQVKKGTPQTFKMRINNVNDLFGEDYDDVDTVIEVNAGLDADDLALPAALVAAIKANEAKVKGLPSGLKWNAKKGCFEGWVKTVKAGKEFYTVTFSVGKVVTTLTFKVNNQIGLDVALEEKTYTVYCGEKTELNAVSAALTVCYDDDKKHELDIENLTVKATGLPKGLSLKYNKSAQAYEITGTTKATAGSYPLTLSVTDKRLKLKQEKVTGLTIEVEDVPGELAGDFYAMDVENGLYVAINRPKGLGGKAVIETGAKKYTLSFCASLEEDTTYHAYYKKGTRISDNLPAIDLTDGKMKITLPDGTEVELPYEKKVAPSSDLVRKNEPCDLTEYGFTDATLSIDKKGAVTVKAKNEANKKVTLKGVLLEEETIYLFAKPNTFVKYSLID